MQDLMSGQVQLMIDNVPTALEQIRAGKVNALLVTSERRIPQLPDTPSSVDAGLPQYIGYSWLALIAPKATPDAAVAALYAAATTTLADARAPRSPQRHDHRRRPARNRDVSAGGTR
jgi:tripartite-type tricarboxylate transporter receptor subunit TctC